MLFKLAELQFGRYTNLRRQQVLDYHTQVMLYQSLDECVDCSVTVIIKLGTLAAFKEHVSVKKTRTVSQTVVRKLIL